MSRATASSSSGSATSTLMTMTTTSGSAKTATDVVVVTHGGAGSNATGSPSKSGSGSAKDGALVGTATNAAGSSAAPTQKRRGKAVLVKASVLTLLLCQNTVYTLVRRYSMASLAERYDPHMVLLVGEVMKLGFSAFMMRVDDTPSDADVFDALPRRLAYLTLRSGKMFVLALIYGVMNVLSYFAIKRVDAAVFTVCAQLKILTTAFFAVIILRKPVSGAKWRALLQLGLGCVLVTVPQLRGANGPSTNPEGHRSRSAFVAGLVAVFVEVSLSGFASIYFERAIKAADEKMTVWDRNFQLALHSIVLYVSYELARDATFTQNPRFPLHDFSAVAWLLAFLSAAGGLLVALTVKVADSVVKTLAVSSAIVTSTLASHYLLNGPLDLTIASGALVVALAVLNYAFDPTPRPPPANAPKEPPPLPPPTYENGHAAGPSVRRHAV